MPKDHDRYVPDLSEVPPDPADPIVIGVDPGHDGGTRFSVWSVKPDPTGKMRPTLIAVSDTVATCPDPAHPCIVSASVGSGPPPDVGMPTHATLHFRPRSESALLSAHRRFVENFLTHPTGANAPADGDPPRPTKEEGLARLRATRADFLTWLGSGSDATAARWDALLEEWTRSRPTREPGPTPAPLTGKRARAVIVDDPWPERDGFIAREQAAVFERLAEPRGALTYPDAGRVWLPPRHGKSIVGMGVIADLMRAKDPPQLPPSPVVQAALVVDPEE